VNYRAPFPSVPQRTGRGAIWLITLLTFLGVIKPVASQQSFPALEEGRPIERELAGGETHAFQVTLAAGQYLRVVVDQRGIDVALRIFGADGQKMVEMDSPNATQGPEAISVVAEQPGSYRVEISSLNKGALAGRYEAKVAALRPATEQDRKWIAAQSAYNEGQGLRRRGDAESWRKSIESYHEAIRNWQAAGDRLMEAHALYCIGSAWKLLGQPQKALECFSQALQLQRPEDGWREEANTLYLMGLVYINDLNDSRQALERSERALSMQQAMSDDWAEALTLGNMGLAYLMLGEARKSLEYYQKPLTVWRKTGYRSREALILHNTGRAYEDLGAYQRAMGHYLGALALYRASQNRGGEAEELNSIGFVNRLLGEWKKALEYYSQALLLWRATGDSRREAITLSNIGIAYASLNETEKALENYQQALKLHREAGNLRSEAVTLEMIGELHAAALQLRKRLLDIGDLEVQNRLRVGVLFL